MAFFKTFRSTVAPFLSIPWVARMKLLVDPVTGAPTGVQNINDNGADGVWAPIDLTPAQLATPTAAMIADLNSTYRSTLAPYKRYRSDGVGLREFSGTNIQGPDGLWGTMIVYSPFTVTDPVGITVEGTIYVRNLPA